MTSHFTSRLFIFSLFFCIQTVVSAQKSINPHPDADKIATAYLQKQQTAWNLTPQDVKEFVVQDAYHTEHNGVTHVYLVQQYKGIELHNAITTVNVLPNGEVLHAGNRFMKNLAAAVNTTEPKITPEEAISNAAKELDIKINVPLRVIEKKSALEFVFDKGNFVLSDINIKLRYQKINEKEVRLAWDLNLDQPDGNNHWSVRVDALTGKIIHKLSWTVHCRFDKDPYHNHSDNCEAKAETQNLPPLSISEEKKMETAIVGAGSYRVFPLPVESPAHGTRTLVVSPADSLASPYGWHDVNGSAGGEYRYTRGNNVWAYLDRNGDNTADAFEPTNNDYIYDYPFLPDGEPDTNKLAAITNLFYMNNMMHDISFRYGFNEDAGNFQQRNYKGGLGGNDDVRAEAQDGFKATDPTYNNANFNTPPDGSRPRMQMFAWTRTSEKFLKITAPANAIGEYEAGTASFGSTLTSSPITGNVVVVSDGSTNATQGCGTITTNLTGKIALIDRGNCDFSQKVFNAQQKGAIACIVCNFENSIMGMGAGANAASVTIPSIFLRKNDCDKIRNAIANGVTASLSKPATAVGPDYIDGDFDNGVIAHEYTHGITARLTGGPKAPSCVYAGELAAGEGWSDFLALAVTAKQGDKSTTNRGVGNYVTRKSIDREGVRRYPFTTDLKVNPLTYDQIIFTPLDNQVHQVGEVWVSTLWDMYWALVDKYGWDSNIMNTNSGNGRAIKLVIDGMKMQPCDPGFIDARDAILAADRVNNNGDNQCLIWEVFARRGLGSNANQGTSDSKTDNTEGYDKLPSCIKELKITKKATDLIKAGEAITYTINVTNHKGIAASGVVVTDELPSGTTYVTGSASRTVSVANGILTWNIGDLKIDSTTTLTYRVTSDPNKKSVAQFTDDMENGEGKWDVDQLTINPEAFWEILDIYSRSGKKAFAVGYPGKDPTDQTLTLKNGITVAGSKPILRFYHRYQTEPAFDAGILQITTDNGTTWTDLGNKAFRTPYRGAIEYTLFAIPNQKGFWGKQDSFLGTYIDLKDYAGKNIKFRYRFATDSTEGGLGWFVDDVAVMDMYNYTSKARVISAQKDTAYAEPDGRGTIVDASGSTAVKDINNDLTVKVYPNPTDELLNINITGAETAKADVQIYSADGRIMWQSKTDLWGQKETIVPVYTASYPSGIYFVKISTDKNVAVEKVIKK